jgi:hypothetical protein
MKLKVSGVIYGGMPTTLLQNFIISLIKMPSPQNLSYGSGTPAALTKSESSVGSCLWIESMLETFSEEKSTSWRGITSVLCHNNRQETTFHLFFSCPFSQECWSSLNTHWNFTTDFYNMMDEAKSQFTHKFFMEVFIIATWLIWKQRNNFIFNKVRPGFQGWKSGFLDEARLQAYRMSVNKK